jgi:hypothetical protein
MPVSKLQACPVAAIMPMPENERRELCRLENQLMQQGWLVKRVHHLSSANVDTGFRTGMCGGRPTPWRPNGSGK